MAIKYPETLAEIGREHLIMAANTKMRPLTGEDFAKGISPMTVYKSWSVLNLNFADSDKKTGGSGSIEIDHLEDVRIRTQIAMQAVMEQERKQISNNPEQGGGDSAAGALLATKIFFLPKEIKAEMRGKTALEIASACGSENARIAAQNLRNSAKNNEKYRANNLKQAEALELASVIFEAKERSFQIDGKEVKVADLIASDPNRAVFFCNEEYKRNPNNPCLMTAMNLMNAIKQDRSILSILKDGSAGKAENHYMIYGPVLKTPHIEKVDKDGYTKVYSLVVWCNPSQLPYPFHVELQTMLGIPKANRQVGVEGSTIKDRQTFSIDLMTWEWLNLVARADWESKLVALWAHEEQFNAMVSAVTENRAQASGQAPRNQQPYQNTQWAQPPQQSAQPYSYVQGQPTSYPYPYPYPYQQN